MTRAEIIAEARKWLGTPYRPRGRSARGLDCLGLLVKLGEAFAVPHVDTQDYSLWPAGDHRILHTFDRFLVRMPPDSRLPGLVGVFAERRLPGHCGVFSTKHDADHLIHARIRPGRIMEEPWALLRRGELRLIGLFAMPGLED